MVAIDSPLSPLSTTDPFTMYGPFSTHWIVAFVSPQPLGMSASLSGFLERSGDLGSVLEDRGAVSRLWHNREVELAGRTWFREGLLFTIELERFVLDMIAGRADAKQARVLELEVGNDVLHDGAVRRPCLDVLVIDRHVPVLERLFAGPETHFVEPGRVVRMDPPCQMQEARQRLQMAPDIREKRLELLIAIRARKSHALHALVNRHWIPHRW